MSALHRRLANAEFDVAFVVAVTEIMQNPAGPAQVNMKCLAYVMARKLFIAQKSPPGNGSEQRHFP